MRLRFKGDGAVDDAGNEKPCVVFGHTFVPGEWESPDLLPAQLAKLAGNPAFDFEGKVPPAVAAPVPQAEPDPEADEEQAPPAEGTEAVAPVEIPDDWTTRHWKKRQAIAAKIDPQADGVNAEASDAIIAAEIARRAG